MRRNNYKMNKTLDIEDIQNCPTDIADAGKSSVCTSCPGQQLCQNEGTSSIEEDSNLLNLRLNAIKHKILILSGKGGVGKSSIASSIAQIVASRGFSVGVLDVDICGPSTAHLLGVSGESILDSQWGWKPLQSPFGKIKTISVASLLASNTQAVVWKGPRKVALIRRMLKDVLWGRLDYLIIDTPPGTSDEHLSIVRLLAASKPDGAVIVTTPQMLSAGVVSREIRFCQKLNVPILGLIENMSGFTCSCCDEVTEVFKGNAGTFLSESYKVALLGQVPLSPAIGHLQEKGKSLLQEDQSPFMTSLSTAVDKILEKCS